MERRREGERDDLLRRGPRLSRRPYCASLTPNGVPSTDPRRVYRCVPPTLHPARTAPFAIRLFTTLQAVTTSSSSTRFLPPSSYPLAMPLPTDPWRPFALSRGCESRVPAVYDERIAKESS